MPGIGEGPVVREVTFADLAGVSAVKERCGFEQETEEKWHWLWRDNPVLLVGRPEPPMGWVLENGKGIVGYLGNIPMLYSFGGRAIVAAAATAFAVDPEYRGSGLKLASAFMKQQGVDLLLSTTANPAAAKIWRFFRARKVPQGSFDELLYWITDPADFLYSASKHLHVPAALGWLGSRLLSLPLWCEIGLRKRRLARPSSPGLVVTKKDPAEIDDEFDRLWTRASLNHTRIMKSRSSSALKWQFCFAPANLGTTVLCCRAEGTLAGYAIVKPVFRPALGLKALRILDIFAENDESDIIQALVSDAFDHCRSERASRLEVSGFPASVQRVLRNAHPYVRRSDNWPYWYKAVDDELNAALENSDAWYTCPTDGDANLFS